MSDRDDLIAKARKVSAAATEGPWDSCVVEHEITTREGGELLLRAGFSAQATDADLLFIAESRTLLPALADLAESEGRRADEAEALVNRSQEQALEAIHQRDKVRKQRDIALAEIARLKGQQP